MRGDFSRIRFNNHRGYTAVLEQQGRVALDSDANEQWFIDNYLRTTEATDVIGAYGAPAQDAGFAISVNGNQIEIGPGRYYVDGVLCTSPSTHGYDEQPYLLGAPSAAGLLAELAAASGKMIAQVYMEVWERWVTWLDDPCLREPALGQADTTGRVQTVSRVVAQLLPQAAAAPPPGTPAGVSPCCQWMYHPGQSSASTAAMSAATAGPSADCGCQPVAAAGYQGVENQLYRVEIHLGGRDTDATFKWSRENGSVVAAVTDIAGSTVAVNSLGPDANLGFQSGQWVELTDDTYLFGEAPNQPGNLYPIKTVQPADPSVTLSGTVTPVDPAQNARVRRWDQSGPAATANGIPLAAGTWITLENGIQVCFAPGVYTSGDFWMIPARTATGTIEWPPCGGDGRDFQAPTRLTVQRAPLACIHFQPGLPLPVPLPGPEPPLLGLEVEAAAARPHFGHFVVDDCRLKFDPLTSLAAPSAIQALHVDSVSWVNDDVTTLDQLVAGGLTVTLDQAATSPVTGANFIVTIEIPNPPKSRIVGQAPETVARAVAVLDSEITVHGVTIDWQVPWANANVAQREAVLALEEALLPGAADGLFARIRVKLLGATVFAPGAGGSLYLDGRALGVAGVRADGSTPRIDLQLPSGEGELASDFDGWFYLAPTMLLTSLTVAYPEVSVVVSQANAVTAVVDKATGQAVKPTATAHLNFPAVNATTLALALTGPAGVDTVASIQPSVAVAPGERDVTFPIDILSNPGSPQITDSFEIGATLTSTLGTTTSASATFTVTGALEPTQ